MRHPLTVLTALTLLLPALAGCLNASDVVDPTADDGTPDDIETTTTLDWGLAGCEALIAMVPVPKENIQPHVPEGFEAVIPDAIKADLPPDPRGDAIMGLEFLTCKAGAGLSGSVEGMTYGSFWTFAEPPAELKDPEKGLHFVKWDVLIPDADRRALLQQAGVAARDGDAEFLVREAKGNGGAFSATLTLGEDVFGFHGVGGQPYDFTGTFEEFSATGDGDLVRWSTAFSASAAHAGTGYVKLAPGSLPAQVIGQDRAPAWILTGTGVEFTDATITLPTS